MIVLLSHCFLSTLEAQNRIKGDSIIPPVEGLYIIPDNDTTKVCIPIKDIKIANIKMNERLHLLDITAQQELNIMDYKSYINNQDTIIKDFQNRLSTSNDINKNLHNAINKERNKNKIWKGTAIGAVAVTILVIFLK